MLLASCVANRVEEEDKGPDFIISGTVLSRQVGKATQKLNYLWVRGIGFDGWKETITLENQTGIELARVVETASGVRITTQRGSRKIANMQELFSNYFGVPIAPSQLAKWIYNQYETGSVPDQFKHGDLVFTVRKRDSQERIQTLQINHNDNIFVIDVENFNAG